MCCCYVEHGFCRGVSKLVVFGKSSGSVEPREGALDDPAFGKDFEAVLLVTFDDLHLVAEHLSGPVDELAGVAAIGEDGGHRAGSAEEPRQHGTGSDPVLDAGRVDHRGEQVTLAVYRDMALTALGPLARVVAALPPFNAVLAVCESTMATVGVARRPPALRPCSRRAWLTLFPRTIVAPSAKLLVYGQPGWKIIRQLTPLAACLDYVKQRVNDPPKLILARPATCMTPSTRPFQQRLQLCSLHLRQIARIHLYKLKDTSQKAYRTFGPPLGY